MVVYAGKSFLKRLPRPIEGLWIRHKTCYVGALYGSMHCLWRLVNVIVTSVAVSLVFRHRSQYHGGCIIIILKQISRNAIILPSPSSKTPCWQTRTLRSCVHGIMCKLSVVGRGKRKTRVQRPKPQLFVLSSNAYYSNGEFVGASGSLTFADGSTFQ